MTSNVGNLSSIRPATGVPTFSYYFICVDWQTDAATKPNMWRYDGDRQPYTMPSPTRSSIAISLWNQRTNAAYSNTKSISDAANCLQEVVEICRNCPSKSRTASKSETDKSQQILSNMNWRHQNWILPLSHQQSAWDWRWPFPRFPPTRTWGIWMHVAGSWCDQTAAPPPRSASKHVRALCPIQKSTNKPFMPLLCHL